MTHIKTSSGFEGDFDETCADDMELFDAIVEVEKGNMLFLPTVVGKVLGGSKKALYDFCRNENGRVPTGKITKEVIEILNGLNAKK